MSTARQIADNIRMDILGGQLTDQPQIELLQVYEKMNQARATIFNSLAVDGKFGVTDSNGLQTYICVYDSTIQDNKQTYVRYKIPQVIDIFGNIGLFWVGRLDRTQDFRIVSNLGQISNINKIKSIKPSSLRLDAYSHNGYLYVYGDLNLKTILVEAYFSDPFGIPIYSSNNTASRAYNEDLDEYPISGSYINLLYELVRKQLSAPLLVDKENDGTLTNNQQVK